MNDQSLLPHQIIGRQAELTQACQILSADGDMLLAGVPGIGRKTLIRAAAQTCQTKVIEIDCLKATSYKRFLDLMAAAFSAGFNHPTEQACLQQLSQLPLEFDLNQTSQLTWQSQDNWEIFQLLLALPQLIAEALNYRVVLVFQNFPHLRSWDKQKQWETYLTQQIHVQPRVSYALIATVAESSVAHPEIQILSLKPIHNAVIEDWFTKFLCQQAITFEADAASQFARYVQGNFGDAIALARRVQLDHQARQLSRLVKAKGSHSMTLQDCHVHDSAMSLIADLAVTFESLILLLPPTQIRVLESLALDPTAKPQAREYIQKHDLSRGGTLQGALASLVQKGLIYDATDNYRVALPLLALWLKHRCG